MPGKGDVFQGVVMIEFATHVMLMIRTNVQTQTGVSSSLFLNLDFVAEKLGFRAFEPVEAKYFHVVVNG